MVGNAVETIEISKLDITNEITINFVLFIYILLIFIFLFIYIIDTKKN